MLVKNGHNSQEEAIEVKDVLRLNGPSPKGNMGNVC